MVWEAIGVVAIGQLAFIDSIMNRHLRKNILEEHLLSSANSLDLESN